MQDFIINAMNQWGYLGVFLLIAIENIFPPIPSEVILLFGGALTAAALGGKLSIFWMIVAATLASLAGAILLYYIGKILKTERLKRIVSGRVGKVLRLKPADIDRADKWFDEKGNITVFICRCVPLLRSLISIPAGMSEMPMGKFILYTVVGSAIWNTILVAIGHNLGNNWESILGFFDNFSHLVVAICAVIAVVVLVWWFGFYRRGKKSDGKKRTATKVSEASDKNDDKHESIEKRD